MNNLSTTDQYLGTAQQVMYETLNAFSEDHPCLSRLGSIPVAIGDVGLQFLKVPLGAIECLALAALHLFAKTYQDALINVGVALCIIAHLPGSVFLSPIKLFLQILGGLIDPKNMTTCNPARHGMYTNI